MIEVFRELEVSKLPPQMIQSVAVIRSGVYAINNRIDEVLKDDGKRKAERRSRLHSAGRTLAEVREQFAVLKMHYRPWNRKKFTLNALSDRMAVFLMEAKQALQQPAQTHRP